MVRSEQRIATVGEMLLSELHNKRAMKKCESVNEPKVVSKNLPIGIIIFGLLVMGLGAMVIVLRGEVTTLKVEVEELRGLKAQIIADDPKFKIAAFESKLKESDKDKEVLKSEMAQIKTDLKEVKNVRGQRKR